MSDAGVPEQTPGRSVREIAELLEGELSGSPELMITGVHSLDEAQPGQMTFITDEQHARSWPQSKAGAAVVSRAINLPDDPLKRPVIQVPDGTLASFALLAMFAPAVGRPETGIHAAASIDPSARIAQDAAIGAHVVVGPRCVIGARCVLHPGVTLYEDVTIGAGSELHANVVVRHRCSIGSRVIIHQNASIGADGFGYRPAPGGSGLIKAPHIGTVIIEDDVEIGANSCIDRAKLGKTIIGAGTKIDNLVQIGHNCRIGRCCVIAAQVGLAGSVVVEDWAMVGGQVGVAEHRIIGTGSQVAAQSGILRNVKPGQMVMGSPAEPIKEHLRMHAALHTLSGSRSRRKRP